MMQATIHPPRRVRKTLVLTVSTALLFAFGPTAHADTTGPVTFEGPTFTTGSVNGQNGWLATGNFDQAVAPSTRFPGFGTQALRVSNSVASGSFGDQTFSAPLASPAAETAKTHFDATFQVGTTLNTEQPGLHMAISPDNGTGGRMSYLRFEDQANGVHVFFDDVTDAGPLGTVADFYELDIATITRADAHTVRFSIDLLDGPSNDVVKVYIDGALKATGTTWENYYRYDPEAAASGNTVPVVSKMLIRESGTAAPDTAGQGFLVDNLAMASTSPIPASGPPAPVTRMDDFNMDGRTDLVARDAAGGLWVYPGNGSGGFLARHQIGVGWNSMTVVTPGDVTGDGSADIIAKDTTGRLWLYQGYGPRRQIGSGWGSYTISAAANMNGNGRPDLLARDSAGTLWLYPFSGNAVFGARVKVGFGWGAYTIMGAGDVSGDGRADILARDAAGSMWLYRGNNAGRVYARTLVSTGWQSRTAVVAPGNWDRRSGNDLLARDSAGRLWFTPGNNAGGMGAARVIGTGWGYMTFMG